MSDRCPNNPAFERKTKILNDSSPFICMLQKKLLQTALAPWPRRECPLLVINCGDGDLLRFYWQSGFDLVATEEDFILRQEAFHKNIPHLDLRGASDDDLPFEDYSFDWVILHIRHSSHDRLQACVTEALRVGKRGIMLTFWNKTSLGWTWAKLRGQGELFNPSALYLKEVITVIKRVSSGTARLYSTLLLPAFTWRPGSFWSAVNNSFSNLPYGTWCVLRLTPEKGKLITPLPLRLEQTLHQPDTALEYIHKHKKNNRILR